MEELNEKMMNYFKTVCLETSKLSTCVSKQVGAVLVLHKRIIAIGFNGVPSGQTHCNELFDKNYFDRDEHSAWSKTHEFHAEENVLSFCMREGISTKDTTLFVSLSPCSNCAKLILNSGITNIYYIEEYDKDKNGIQFLKDNNINIRKI